MADSEVQTKAVRAQTPPPPKETQRRSVTDPFISEGGPGGGDYFTMWFASIADTFTRWGTLVSKRDRELRDFWPSESNLASAVYTVSIANAALEWEIEAPPRTQQAVHDLLTQANLGKGFGDLLRRGSIDFYTQDNGAFIELIRATDSPSAPLVGIQTLDSGMCVRTGDLETPVIYTDEKGKRHKMKWYQIVPFEEFPSPIQQMHGVQYCAVTRCLRTSQIMRDTAIYRGEKVGGRNAEAIHIVGGISQAALEDVRKRMQETADNEGRIRYMEPLLLAGLDPNAAPSVATILMKSLPENFDFDNEMRWYIASLAMAFGRDYQEFAPLPGGNLGTSQQSYIQHLKSRGKGPATFVEVVEHVMNNYVMPRTATFRFKVQDIELEGRDAEIGKTRAEARQIRIDSGEITPEIARQIANDQGDLDQKYIMMMGEEDLTPDTTIEGGENPEQEMDVEEDIEMVEEEKALDGVFSGMRRFFNRSLNRARVSGERSAAAEALRAATKALQELED